MPLAALTVPEDLGLVNFVACCYSTVPFVASVVNLLLVCMHRRPREANWFLCTTTSSLLHVVLKYIFSESRPVGSCLSSCGMPSGHSTYAMGMFLLLIYDLVLAQHACAPGDSRANRAVVITVALVPVTWSRWKIRDHSLAQIIAGGALGTFVSVLWVQGVGRWCERRMPSTMRANADGEGLADGEDAEAEGWKRGEQNGAELQRISSSADSPSSSSANGARMV